MMQNEFEQQLGRPVSSGELKMLMLAWGANPSGDLAEFCREWEQRKLGESEIMQATLESFSGLTPELLFEAQAAQLAAKRRIQGIVQARKERKERKYISSKIRAGIALDHDDLGMVLRLLKFADDNESRR